VVVERLRSGGAEVQRCRGADTELLRCRCGGADVVQRLSKGCYYGPGYCAGVGVELVQSFVEECRGCAGEVIR
jgi:hypothetical protein